MEPAICADYLQQQDLLDHGYVRYIGHYGDSTSVLESARMSTLNPTGVDKVKDRNLLEFLWRSKHATPFEFVDLTVEIQCPIMVTRQWHRHRTFSFNEASGRYSKLMDLCYLPTLERIQGQGKANKQGSEGDLSLEVKLQVQGSMAREQKEGRVLYEDYSNSGVANELARINVPVSQYTRFRAKANLRNWLAFLVLRMDSHAQYEIRVYADAVANIIQQLWPDIWEIYVEHTLDAKTFSGKEVCALQMMVKALQETGVDLVKEFDLDNQFAPKYRDELLTKLGVS